MAKSLTNASTTPVLASALSGIMAAVRSIVSGLASGARADVEALPDRLRYDMGELDINPDVGSARHAGSDSAREMMRRQF